ncbi:unnamed protein product, partial [Allacma fusca]
MAEAPARRIGRKVSTADFTNPSEPEGSGLIELLATCGSILLLVVTIPIAIFFCFKVVQEYERAVIFRLGRLRRGGARGPGIFFILPCIDAYRCVDLRTVSFDVPPQETPGRWDQRYCWGSHSPRGQLLN